MEDLDLLQRLADARGIPFDREVLPRSQRFVTRTGQRLHYLAWGGHGPPVILLHGGALTARTWDLVALQLSRFFTCVALDLRGHGDSGWADSYRIADHVDDVLALVDHLGLDRVHLVGMSLGGCVAGHAAAALGKRMTSLAFVDVGAEVDFNASANLRSFMTSIAPVERVEDLAALALQASPRTDPELMLYRYKALTHGTAEGVVLRQDRRRGPDFAHILDELSRLSGLAPRIDCPTVVVRGGRSRTLSNETAARFAARFPNGRWAVVPSAGHNVQEDQPRRLSWVLGAHLEGARQMAA